MARDLQRDIQVLGDSEKVMRLKIRRGYS